jgi:hypothetical protein
VWCVIHPTGAYVIYPAHRNCATQFHVSAGPFVLGVSDGVRALPDTSCCRC